MAGVSYTLGELAQWIDARVEGDVGVFVFGLGSLVSAIPGDPIRFSWHASGIDLPHSSRRADNALTYQHSRGSFEPVSRQVAADHEGMCT